MSTLLDKLGAEKIAKLNAQCRARRERGDLAKRCDGDEEPTAMPAISATSSAEKNTESKTIDSEGKPGTNQSEVECKKQNDEHRFQAHVVSCRDDTVVASLLKEPIVLGRRRKTQKENTENWAGVTNNTRISRNHVRVSIQGGRLVLTAIGLNKTRVRTGSRVQVLENGQSASIGPSDIFTLDEKNTTFECTRETFRVEQVPADDEDTELRELTAAVDKVSLSVESALEKTKKNEGGVCKTDALSMVSLSVESALEKARQLKHNGREAYGGKVSVKDAEASGWVAPKPVLVWVFVRYKAVSPIRPTSTLFENCPSCAFGPLMKPCAWPGRK